MISRKELISQLRSALHKAESPFVEVVEFDVGETSFEFDFEGDQNG